MCILLCNKYAYPIEKLLKNTLDTEDDNVYINSEHSGKQLLHSISEFPSVLFGSKLLNTPVTIKLTTCNVFLLMIIMIFVNNTLNTY